MKDQFAEEKELLIMKGDALRMKLLAQGLRTKQNISDPVAQLKSISSTLSQPAVRALLLSLINRKLLSVRGLTYSALGLGAIYLLNNKQK
ncbi:hypothetical protein [Lonepinella sp. MS14435]|uniref:hypothetical protein n=1 Tax=Lonepinella sp. MS14435 TaxID=3003618 RepID=UPI0036DC9C3A